MKNKDQNNQLFLNHLNQVYVDLANWFWWNNEAFNDLSEDEKSEIIILIKNAVSNFETIIWQTTFNMENIEEFTNNWWEKIIWNQIYTK